MNAPALRLSHWLGLLAAPLAFLTLLVVAYPLVPWACATQRHEVLHAVAAVTLLAILATVASGWRAYAASGASTSAPVESTERFLAGLSVGVSLLSALATVALWFTAFALSPCLA
jgi:hypothetical protein